MEPSMDNDGIFETEDTSPIGVNLRFYPISGGSTDEDADEAYDHFDHHDTQHNTSSCSSSSGSTPLGIHRKSQKAVKFAQDEAEKMDGQRDKRRSRQELLAKIAKLTDTLKDCEKRLAAEKDKRRKKEKCLLKLAKELKKRAQKDENEKIRIEELEQKKRYLEHQWELAQKELDQLKASHAKRHVEAQKEFEETMQDEKARYAKTAKDHDARLEDLKRAHQEQCDELEKEIRKQKLEARRLQQELTSKGVKVSRHTLFKEDATASQSLVRFQIVTACSILFIAIFLVWGVEVDMFTKSGFCAPVMPGTELNSATGEAIFQAPWWAPPPLKVQAFANVCSDNDGLVTPTAIEWKQEGNKNKFILSVAGKVKVKRSVARAEIMSNKLRLWKRNGQGEEETSPW